MLSTPRFSLSVSALPLSARAHRATPRFQRAHPSCPAARRSSGVKSGEGWPQRPRPVASKRGSEWHGRLGAAAPDRRGLRALWARAAILRRRPAPAALSARRGRPAGPRHPGARARFPSGPVPGPSRVSAPLPFAGGSGRESCVSERASSGFWSGSWNPMEAGPRRGAEPLR